MSTAIATSESQKAAKPTAEQPPMSLAFIVPAATPGTSGVGDYALCLAAALMEKEARAGVIAWNEPEIVAPETPQFPLGNGAVPCLLLPKAMPDSEKTARMRKWVYERKVDWLSLQYSGYGYDARGTSGGLPGALKPLREGRHLQIMFHETWIGLEQAASWKDRILGKIQAHSIHEMVRQLKPDLTTTSNTTYQKALQFAGIDCQLLPLPSNIPVVDFSAAKNENQFVENESSIGLFFGTIHPNIEFAATISFLKDMKERLSNELKLYHVGNLSRDRKDLIERLSDGAELPSRPRFLGCQPPEVISTLHHLATFGISTNPIALWGKSGSLATALEHDLPVLGIAKPWRLRQEPTFQPPLPERLFTLDTHPAQFLSAVAEPRNLISDRTETVAADLIRLLQESA